MAERLRLAGAPQSVIEQVVAKDAAIPEIQSANIIPVRLFFACATQWNYAGMAGTRTGLNYQAVDVRAAKMPDFQALTLEEQNWVWEAVNVMEAAALKVWQEQQRD